MPFKSKLEAEFVPGKNRLVVTAPLIYFDNKTERLYRVPIGFVCDGASIPRIFWSLVGHPFNKGHRAAAVLHDYLCRHYGDTRALADRIFRSALQESTPKKRVKPWVFWAAVRLGSFF